jgi:hypothetical protein
MQIHGPSETADTAKFSVYLNGTGDPPFAVVRMGHVTFYASTPAECDAAIRVWVEAKQLLPGEDAFCPAVFTDDDIGTFYCDRERGHAGSHHAPGADEWSEVAWDDEPAKGAPGPLAIACPSCGAEPGQRCTSDFGCMARYYATQVTS